MTFREVLQIELWSKQTSRKILKVVGISFGTVVGIASIGLMVEVLWINPQERKAAKIALADVEDLQQVDATKEAEYKVRKDKAESAIDRALQAAWTRRDEHIADALQAYLMEVEMQHDEPYRRAALEAFYQRNPRYRKKPVQQQKDLTPQIRDLIGKNLHGALD